MKLVAALARSLQADMQVELRNIERGVTTGTRDAGRGLKTELRRQVDSAALGQRIDDRWRDPHYSNQKPWSHRADARGHHGRGDPGVTATSGTFGAIERCAAAYHRG